MNRPNHSHVQAPTDERLLLEIIASKQRVRERLLACIDIPHQAPANESDPTLERPAERAPELLEI